LPDNCPHRARGAFGDSVSRSRAARCPRSGSVTVKPRAWRGLIRLCVAHARERCVRAAALIAVASCFDFSKRTSFHWFCLSFPTCHSRCGQRCAFTSARQYRVIHLTEAMHLIYYNCGYYLSYHAAILCQITCHLAAVGMGRQVWSFSCIDSMLNVTHSRIDNPADKPATASRYVIISMQQLELKANIFMPYRRNPSGSRQPKPLGMVVRSERLRGCNGPAG
jgi:hypothetical protein